MKLIEIRKYKIEINTQNIYKFYIRNHPVRWVLFCYHFTDEKAEAKN